ncbi:MAG: T9SS type A sorting domain-containing protein [Bacteroidia bacterium]|nr:T9SS type A sorting domain-containing protein [Bacteroidia bacterium]MCF8425821.1 T9SS type A sorting domain-containing protein [Bacteroidia bacterium]MCF8447691.1 T9SS type A sorting domain-containing protein [Bacteroidia bacterium]
MKKLLLLLFVFASDMPVMGQLVANGGPDVRLCSGITNLDSVTIGALPTASGGYPPYRYIWYGSNTINPNNTYHASYYLSDTTIANPKLKGYVTMKFNLIVIDSLGNFATGFTNVQSRGFAMNLSVKQRYIKIKDTTFLYTSLGGGFPPYKYYWTPNYNISNQNSENPLVWPDTSTRYYLTIIDDIGCVSQRDFVDVHVFPTGLTKSIPDHNKITIIPNPIIDKSTIKFKDNTTIQKLQILDVFGRLVYTIILNGNSKIEIEKDLLGVGVFNIIAIDEDNYYQVGKVVVR